MPGPLRPEMPGAPPQSQVQTAQNPLLPDARTRAADKHCAHTFACNLRDSSGKILLHSFSRQVNCPSQRGSVVRASARGLKGVGSILIKTMSMSCRLDPQPGAHVRETHRLVASHIDVSLPSTPNPTLSENQWKVSSGEDSQQRHVNRGTERLSGAPTPHSL